MISEKELGLKFVALLRGVNAGKMRRIEMKRLKELFESLGYLDVATYINSGNVVFGSSKRPGSIKKEIEAGIKKKFGFDVPILIKTASEMKRISRAIPIGWLNDGEQRTDVAYLFKEMDSKEIIDDLPIKKEYVNIRYVKGAVFWSVLRKNYNKSRLNKIISHRSYQFMTVRNVNTARFLGGI